MTSHPIAVATSVLTIALSASPLVSQVTFGFSAETPIVSSAFVPGQPNLVNTTPAGPLSALPVEQTALVVDPLSAQIARSDWAVRQLGSNRLKIEARTQVTAVGGYAELRPSQFLIDVQVAGGATQVGLSISLLSTAVGAGGSLIGVDVGDDGIYDVSGDTANVLLPVSLVGGHVPIRVAISNAASGSGANYFGSVDLAVTPWSNCAASPTGTGSCQPLTASFVRPQFDGSLEYRLGADLPATAALVLGTQRLALPIPAPIPSRCMLDPAPEVVLPMLQAAPGLAIGVIPPIPAAMSRIEFFAQPVALDFVTGTIETFPTYRVVCR